MAALNDQIRGKLESLLPVIPVHRLQSVGLAMFYLISTPSNEPNQCVPAAAAMRAALGRYGTKAVIVPATVQVSWNPVVRGSSSPDMQLDGSTNGHFVVVTEHDEFIDPTALQFDDIFAQRGTSGFMPMFGRQKDMWSKATAPAALRGVTIDEALFPIGNGANFITYTLFSPLTGFEVVEEFLTLNTHKNLSGWHQSMADLFAWIVGNHILKGQRHQEISQIPNPAFRQAVTSWIGQPQPSWASTTSDC